MSDGFMAIEGEYGQVVRLAAEQERTMVLRINGHTVIEAAAFYRIPANDAICRRVNLHHFVSGTQRYINPLRNGIVPGVPVSLSNRRTFTISSLSTSITLTALPNVLATYAFRNGSA
jgi:hypothetical protein